ncbi:hypothetical protein ACEPPN_009337 [Leptodophora sp. 'Broadleaf-Isolate-01']
MKNKQDRAADAASPTLNSSASPSLQRATSILGYTVGPNPTTPKTSDFAEKLNEVKKADEEITSPNAAALKNQSNTSSPDPAIQLLLQLAQSSGVAPVQIPGNLLASLLVSMNNLQTQVSSLQGDVVRLNNENQISRTRLAHTKLELEATQELWGVTDILTFPLFPKLPIELRRMVWQFALYIPRVLGAMPAVKLKRGRKSTHKHYGIRDVCMEARVEANKIQTSAKKFMEWAYFEEGCRFMNLEVDTVWLHGKSGYSPQQFLFDLSEGDEDPVPWGPKFPSIVLTFEDWEKLTCIIEDNINMENYYLGSGLSGIGVKHISVVVGDTRPLSAPDVQFVAPQRGPSRTLPSKYFHRVEPEVLLNRPNCSILTWKVLADWHLECLANFQMAREDIRDDYEESK